jgi:hypothetical protein
MTFERLEALLVDAQVIAVVAAVFSAIAAISSAVIAGKAVKNGRKIADAQVLVRFRERYSEDQMSRDLRLLRDWKEQQGERFAVIWHERFLIRETGAMDVDAARRRVSHYFSWIGELYNGSFISKQMALLLYKLDGSEVFLEIVEPLDAILNPNYGKKAYDTLKKLRTRSRKRSAAPQELSHDRI